MTTIAEDMMADVWRDLAACIEPVKAPHPAKWIEENIDLPKSVSPSLPGPVRLMPYQRGVLDALHDPEIREADLAWGTQLGKSALWQWFLGANACARGAPMMVCGADRTSIKNVSRLRLYPTYRNTPAVAALLPHSKHDQDTFLVDLRHTWIRFGWSGSASSLGEATVGVLVLTELDKFTRDISEEADSEDLARNRVKNVPDHKIIAESTPSREDTSRIWKNWTRSDQREYHVPCPHCGAYQVLEWGTAEPGKPGVKWESPDEKSKDIAIAAALARATVYYECAHCHQAIHEEHKWGMLEAGRWVPRGMTVDRAGRLHGKSPRNPRAGFRLSSLYSPIVTWGDMAALFLEKKREGLSGLQDFWNSWLALPWRDRGEAPEWEVVGSRLRLETLTPGVVPGEALVLTAAIDRHERHQNYAVRAWGMVDAAWTSWQIDHGETVNLTEAAEIVLESAYQQAGTRETIQPRMVAVDSGWRPEETYALCRRYPGRAVAVKGHDPWRALYTIASAVINPRTRKPYPGGLALYHIDVGRVKPEIYYKLKDGPRAGEPGAFNLYNAVDEDYLRQLCGETRTTKLDKHNREVQAWEVIDPVIGSHYLDCEVYAWVAAEILRVKMGLGRSGRTRGAKGTDGHGRARTAAARAAKRSWRGLRNRRRR